MPIYSTVAEAIAHVGTDFPKSGFVFQDLKGNETEYSYADIERNTAGRAAELQAVGLQKGDRVGLVVIEPEDFVLTFLACVRIGVLPVPMYPPLSFGALDAYAEKTTKILTSAGASVLIASSRLQNILWSQVEAVPSLRTLLKVEELRGNGREPVYPEITPDDLCFLQYTSGSTSDPKGVMVTHGSLVANCHGIIHEGLKLEYPHDKGISWLPLYHDMGLIGFVMAPICNGISSIFIPTLRFIKRPNVWFESVHRHRATASFAPNFAYALVTRKSKDRDLDRWDLSCLKILGCGAEPIQPETMRAFTDLFHERCDLKKTVIMPAYGMAEATLAMSLNPCDEEFVTRVVHAETFQNEGRCADPVEGEPYVEHVACGIPFEGHDLKALDERGNVLPDGVEGELCHKGPSVTPGYFRNPEATAKAFRDGWLHTGDLGYVHDGRVYVTGRMKDLIILNGRNIHPQSIEWTAVEIDGVRKGNAVAFSVPGLSSEEIVLVLETRAKDKEALAEAVRLHIQREMGIALTDIVCLPAGTLPKTSSGKLQRRKTRQLYLAGKLGVEGSRAAGSGGSRVTVAKHVAKSIWTRAKAAAKLL